MQHSVVGLTDQLPTTVVGGDVFGSLSDVELARTASALNTPLRLHPATFYDLAHKGYPPTAIADCLHIFNKHKAKCFILWVKYHWVTVNCEILPHRIYDSAPSMATRREIQLIYNKMSWQQPTFPPCPRQIRGSEECGIFAITYAYAIHHDLIIPPGSTDPTQNPSLAQARSYLAKGNYREMIATAMRELHIAGTPRLATPNPIRILTPNRATSTHEGRQNKTPPSERCARTEASFPACDETIPCTPDQKYQTIRDRIFGGAEPIAPPKGLRNVGNVCYLNALIQCLTRSTSWHSWLENKDNQKSHLAQGWWKVQRELRKVSPQSATQPPLILNPAHVYTKLLRRPHHLLPARQECAAEAFQVVLDQLDPQQVSPFVGTTRTTISWQQGRTRGTSCPLESTKDEKFNMITLPITSTDLQTLLQRWGSSEQLKDPYTSPQGHKVTNARRKQQILVTPSTITMHIHRAVSPSGRKDRRRVNFPHTVDLSQCAKEAAHALLTAILVHEGPTTNAGHYVAWIRSPDDQKWWKCDDEHITEHTAEEALQQEAYMLFYQKISPASTINHSSSSKQTQPTATKKLALVKQLPHATVANPKEESKKRTPLTNSEIRSILSVLPERTQITVNWAGPNDTTPLTWRGTLHHGKTPGLPKLNVTYHLELCDSCNQWRSLEPLDLPIPFSNTKYFDVVSTGTTEPEGVYLPLCQCTKLEAVHTVQQSTETINSVKRHGEPDLLAPPTLPGCPGEAAPLGQRNPRGPLMRDARQWFIHRGKPPHVTQLAWSALVDETRQGHIGILRTIKSAPMDLDHLPIAKGVVELMRRLCRARAWKWSTLAGALSKAKSALANLPLHTNATCPILIGDDPEYRQAAATAHREELKESGTVGSIPLTLENYQRIEKTLLTEPRLLAFLQAQWTSLARPEDVACIKAQDTKWTSDRTMVAIVREGKRAKRKGPFPIVMLFSTQTASTMTQLVTEHSVPEKCPRIFGSLREATFLKKNLLSALRRVVPLLDLGSIRKGAARTLAEQGVPVAKISELMCHQNVATTMRYLGYYPGAKELAAQAKWTRPLATSLAGPGANEDSASPIQGGP